MKFDFVEDDAFRANLDCDYREAVSALDAKSAKTVCVLCGSIAEALLLDSLLDGLTDAGRRKMVLNSEFAKLIEMARAESFISADTERLLTVLRNYRNLIHPGRELRTKESPTQSGAEIAKSTIDVLSLELGKRRAEKNGFLAEQIVSKVLSDTSFPALLPHLLKSMRPSELKKLVAMQIPDTMLHLYSDPFSSNEAELGQLAKAFEIVTLSNTELKVHFLERYISALKSDSSSNISIFDRFLFHHGMYAELGDRERALVVDHFFFQFVEREELHLLERSAGIGKYLDEIRLRQYFTWLLRLLCRDPNSGDAKRLRTTIMEEYENLDAPTRLFVDDEYKKNLAKVKGKDVAMEKYINGIIGELFFTF